MSSSHSRYDCKLCSMGHGQPPHMVLPSETTEFAACLCRTHSATPISAQCVIACINTWSSHKQMLKWLHVAAISRSYLSLHVFLFLPPNPPVRMWPLHICKLPIVPSFCRVHHFGRFHHLRKLPSFMLGHFLMFPSLIIGHVCVIFHRFSSVFSLCSVSYSIISGLCVPSFPRNCIFDISPFPHFSVSYPIMSRNFRLSYATISGLFRPSCPPHYFQKYPSFMFHHLSPVLAGSKGFDPGLF